MQLVATWWDYCLQNLYEIFISTPLTNIYLCVIIGYRVGKPARNKTEGGFGKWQQADSSP